MVAPVVAAAGVGGILSGLFGRSSAKKSMSFQREMAQKAHQYEVTDLRAAGLNPILSGMGGSGARASGGAMPPTPDFGGLAVASALAKANVENIQANTALTDAKTGALGGATTIGSWLGSLGEYIQKHGGTTARSIQRAVDEYYAERSDINQSKGPIADIKRGPGFSKEEERRLTKEYYNRKKR